MIGSALGSSILGVVFALVYMKKNNIPGKLKVNINYASAPAKHFFKTYDVCDDIEIIDMPTCIDKIMNIHHLITPDLRGKELFYAPAIPAYGLFKSDFDVLRKTFLSFWKDSRLITTNKYTYTCIHIRRGDKLIYEQSLKVHAVEDYKAQVEKLGLSDNEIMIITDEYNTFLEFKKHCPTWKIDTSSLSENNGFNITNINKESVENIAREVERIVDDFKIIAGSKYFIGTSSSSVSFIGTLLCDNKNSVLL